MCSPSRRHLSAATPRCFATSTNNGLFSPTSRLLKKPRFPHMIGEVDFHYSTSLSSDYSLSPPTTDFFGDIRVSRNNINGSFVQGEQQFSSTSSQSVPPFYSPHQRYLYLPLSAVTGGRLTAASEYLLVEVARSRGFNSQFWITANQLYKRFNGGQVLESERDKGVDVGLGRGPMTIVNLDDIEYADAALFLRSFPLPPGANTVFDTDFDRPCGALAVPQSRHRIFDGLKWQRYRGAEINFSLDALLKHRYYSSSSSPKINTSDSLDEPPSSDNDPSSSSSSSSSSFVSANWIFADIVEQRKMILKPNRKPRCAYECFDSQAFSQFMSRQQQNQNQGDENMMMSSMQSRSYGQSSKRDEWTEASATAPTSQQEGDLHHHNHNHHHARTTTSIPIKSFDQAWGAHSSNDSSTTAPHTTMSRNATSMLDNLWNDAANVVVNHPRQQHFAFNNSNNNNNNTAAFSSSYVNPMMSVSSATCPPSVAAISSSSMSCVFFNAEQTDRYEQIESLWKRYLLPEDYARGNWIGTFALNHQAEYLKSNTSAGAMSLNASNNNNNNNIGSGSIRSDENGMHSHFSPINMSSAPYHQPNNSTASSSSSFASQAISEASRQFWNGNSSPRPSPFDTLSAVISGGLTASSSSSSALPPLSNQVRREVLMTTYGAQQQQQQQQQQPQQQQQQHQLQNGNDDHADLFNSSSTSMMEPNASSSSSFSAQQQYTNNNTNSSSSSASNFLSGFAKMSSRAKLNEADFAWSGCMM